MEFKEFLGDQGWEHTYNFYCPNCKEEVIIRTHDPIEDETMECTMCQWVMLRRDDA